ncbi:MAG: GvpL/GvpF family gas vesicle protein [Chloroflexi bacterium]|nr:GvpL/GvpF family gas vesicle protein [Chloroflexota bacterium]
MLEEGQYIYCIIEASEARNFGSIGIGDRGDPVTTIGFGYGGLAAVVSSTPISKCTVSKETMLAHEEVVERVMWDYTVLPVRFCTVAPSAEDIRNLLRRRYPEFKKLMREFDNKIELGLKALWKDMDAVFSEIRESEITAIGAKEAIPSFERGALGVQVEADRLKHALQERKVMEQEILLRPLRQISMNCCLNNTYGDDMIVNAAFLVDRTWEMVFDGRVDNLISEYGERIEFKYVGPAPPYSFVNIVIGD